MTLTGIRDLLAFANFLKGKNIEFRLEHSRDDALTAQVLMAGIWIEIDFFDDHIEYSVFEGDESVHDDQKRLFALIEERGK